MYEKKKKKHSQLEVFFNIQPNLVLIVCFFYKVCMYIAHTHTHTLFILFTSPIPLPPSPQTPNHSPPITHHIYTSLTPLPLPTPPQKPHLTPHPIRYNPPTPAPKSQNLNRKNFEFSKTNQTDLIFPPAPKDKKNKIKNASFATHLFPPIHPYCPSPLFIPRPVAGEGGGRPRNQIRKKTPPPKNTKKMLCFVSFRSLGSVILFP